MLGQEGETVGEAKTSKGSEIWERMGRKSTVGWGERYGGVEDRGRGRKYIGKEGIGWGIREVVVRGGKGVDGKGDGMK